MLRIRGPFSAVALLAITAASAQTAPPSAPASPTNVLHAGAQLVVVDVTVQDKNGQPVHGLKAENFRVTEDKSPQSILHFEEHSTLTAPAHGISLPKMPPGYFTDYTPIPPGDTLNVLLLDAMNTPTKDQSFVVKQLQQYVNHAPAGNRIAIFGLANRLILLQGFTSDPDTLKNVVDHKLIPRGSPLLNDPNGSAGAPPNMSDLIDPNAPGMALFAANLQQFEAEIGSMQTQLRVQFTLDAFHTLAHYLSAFPGRKNVIWFSGSFPLSILPDPTIRDPFAVTQVDEDEFRDTTSLLARAQVAVYPVDGRGIMTAPVYDVAQTGKSYNDPSKMKFNSDLNKFTTSQAAEHSTMDEMALQTGGKAFYNTNNLADAVTKAINAGANYYTLAYTPAKHADDGAFHDIHVDITGDAPHNLQLAYRHGYYADKAHTIASKPTTPAANDDAAAKSYARSAMSRGAPTPQSMLFKVRLLPASTTTESSVAPANTLDSSVSPKGPFRRFDIDFAALPSELTFTVQPNGNHTAQAEFLAYVFDVDGRLLDATGRTYSIDLGTEAYNRFIHSAMEAHLEVSVPNAKDTFIRLGVRDVASNKFGVVEVPTSDVANLPPVVYTGAPPHSAHPAPTPSTTQPPAPVPSNPPPPQPAPATPPPS